MLAEVGILFDQSARVLTKELHKPHCNHNSSSFTNMHPYIGAYAEKQCDDVALNTAQPVRHAVALITQGAGA